MKQKIEHAKLRRGNLNYEVDLPKDSVVLLVDIDDESHIKYISSNKEVVTYKLCLCHLEIIGESIFCDIPEEAIVLGFDDGEKFTAYKNIMYLVPK